MILDAVAIVGVADSYVRIVGVVVVMDMGQIVFANRNNLAAVDVAIAAIAPFGNIGIPRISTHAHTLVKKKRSI